MSERAHETLDVEFGSLFNYRPQEPCKALFYGRVLTINFQQRTILHPTYQHPRFPVCSLTRCRDEGAWKSWDKYVIRANIVWETCA
jgi:hypothetical protein